MLKFEIKAIIGDDSGPTGSHTIYLFNKANKIILPIKIGQQALTAVLLAREKKQELRPHIHDTTTRLVKALKGKIERIIVSGYADEIFYAYIRIKQGKKVYDIDTKPSDAFAIALRTKSPIYVEAEVVKKIGIKLTPELLRQL